jgi:hypothetical protein
MRHFNFGLLAGVSAAALLLGTSAGANEGQSDDGPHTVVIAPAAPSSVVVTDTETRANSEMIATGLVIFGLSYGAVVIVAATSDRSDDQRLYVPVVGPWLDLANRDSCSIDQASCDGETRNKVLLVADGVFQAGGVLTLVYGLLTPHRVQMTSTSDAGVRVLPTSFGRGAPGISVLGRF